MPLPQKDNLAQLRQQIDELDEQIVALVARRFGITRAIGEIKVRDGLPASHPNRRAHRADLLKGLALRFELDAALVLRFYQPINEEVVGSHKRMGAPDPDEGENRTRKETMDTQETQLS